MEVCRVGQICSCIYLDTYLFPSMSLSLLACNNLYLEVISFSSCERDNDLVHLVSRRQIPFGIEVRPHGVDPDSSQSRRTHMPTSIKATLKPLSGHQSITTDSTIANLLHSRRSFNPEYACIILWFPSSRRSTLSYFALQTVSASEIASKLNFKPACLQKVCSAQYTLVTRRRECSKDDSAIAVHLMTTM